MNIRCNYWLQSDTGDFCTVISGPVSVYMYTLVPVSHDVTYDRVPVREQLCSSRRFAYLRK